MDEGQWESERAAGGVEQRQSTWRVSYRQGKGGMDRNERR